MGCSGSVDGPSEYPEERTRYSKDVYKINRRGISQRRTLIVTNRAVYSVVPKGNGCQTGKCKRRIRILDIASISIPMSKESQEFDIHVPKEYDYRFETPFRDAIVRVLKSAYKTLTRGNELPVHYLQQDTIAEVFVDAETARDLTKASRRRRINRIQSQGLPWQPGELDTEHRDLRMASILQNQKQHASVEDFQFLKVIGRGSFGKVMKVRSKTDGRVYAMKIIRKHELAAANTMDTAKAERRILESLNHPFLISLRFAFQSPSKLYLVIDFVKGGELWFHMQKMGRFSEGQTRFFVAEIALAIGHLHALDILYRDLKPENVLISESGHVKLVDFGLSKELTASRRQSKTLAGTPEYMAPEVLMRQPYGLAIDWWCLGVLCFELCVGRLPWASMDRRQSREMVIKDPVRFPRSGPNGNPLHLTSLCRIFITQLLVKNPARRLGSKRDVEDIKSHGWFTLGRMDWKKLLAKEIPSPYRPSIRHENDNFLTEFTSEPPRDTYAPPVKGGRIQGFSYIESPVRRGNNRPRSRPKRPLPPTRGYRVN